MQIVVSAMEYGNLETLLEFATRGWRPWATSLGLRKRAGRYGR